MPPSNDGPTLETSQALADLQADIELDIEKLSCLAAACEQAGYSTAAKGASESANNLIHLRSLLVSMGVWEDLPMDEPMN